MFFFIFFYYIHVFVFNQENKQFICYSDYYILFLSFNTFLNPKCVFHFRAYFIY